MAVYCVYAPSGLQCYVRIASTDSQSQATQDACDAADLDMGDEATAARILYLAKFADRAAAPTRLAADGTSGELARWWVTITRPKKGQSRTVVHRVGA